MASRTRRTELRLTDQEYAALAEEAKSRGMTVSAYVRLMACDHMGISPTLLYQELVRSRAALVRAREGLTASQRADKGPATTPEAELAQCDAGLRRCIGMVLRDH